MAIKKKDLYKGKLVVWINSERKFELIRISLERFGKWPEKQHILVYSHLEKDTTIIKQIPLNQLTELTPLGAALFN